ncbi:GspE/PulE family protein, partial [Oleiphilus sp. HI0132]
MIANREQLVESLEKSKSYQHQHLGQILLQTGIITSKQLSTALHKQIAEGKKEMLGHILQRLGYASDHQVRNALSCCLEIPFIQLAGFDVDEHALQLVPAEFARAHAVIPLMAHKDRLVVAMEDPSDNETINLLHFLSEQVIEPVLSTASDIEYAISQYYGSTDIDDVLKDMPSTSLSNSWEAQQAIKLASDKPTVKLIHNLIADAVTRRASDIHIRPKEKSVDILYRIDGSLLKIRNFDIKMLPAAVARIKIISGMN